MEAQIKKIGQVKGVGLTTIGRITRVMSVLPINTVSEMWAHCGFGLGNRMSKASQKKVGNRK